MKYKVNKKYKGVIKTIHTDRRGMKIDLDNASQEELKLLHEFAPHYVDIIEPKEKKEAEKVDKKEDKQDESK
jgi:hypothetical protein